jgi:hypothetical protein
VFTGWGKYVGIVNNAPANTAKLKLTITVMDWWHSSTQYPGDVWLDDISVIIYTGGGWLSMNDQGLSTTLPFSTTSGVTVGADLTVNGKAVVTGDIYTVVWTDYSATSTITGWSSFTTKKILYKKVGKLVVVHFHLEGTSNSASSSLTLPYQVVSNMRSTAPGVILAIDNGTQVTTAFAYYNSGGSQIDLAKSIASSSWTSSGTKLCAGHIVYETT